MCLCVFLHTYAERHTHYAAVHYSNIVSSEKQETIHVQNPHTCTLTDKRLDVLHTYICVLACMRACKHTHTHTLSFSLPSSFIIVLKTYIKHRNSDRPK